MDTFPVWGEPAPEWSYNTNAAPQTDDFDGLTQVRQIGSYLNFCSLFAQAASVPTDRDGSDLSLQAPPKPSVRRTGSSKTPSPWLSSSSSGYSSNLSHLSWNESPILPSHLAQNQYFTPGAFTDGPWPQSDLAPVDRSLTYRQDDLSKPLNSLMEYDPDFAVNAGQDRETWQPDPTEQHWDTCDPACYELILEELNKMDANVLADGFASFESNPYTLSGLPDIVEGSEEQSSYAASQDPTSADSPPTSLASNSPAVVKRTPSEAAKESLSTTAMRRPNMIKSIEQIKTDHSVVEKKYRDNLNAKFLELQQCVPPHQVGKDGERGSRAPDAARSRSGDAVKLQKGEIISGAVDYIRELSTRTSDLETYIKLIERRLTVLQKIALQKTNRVDIASDMANVKSHRRSTATKPLSVVSPIAKCPQLTGQVPQSLTKVLDQATLQPLKRAFRQSDKEQVNYAVTQNKPSPSKRRRFSRGELTKVAISSLVGLALFEGYNETEKPAAVPNGRGLLGLPVGFIRHLVRGLSDLFVPESQYAPLNTSADSWIVLKVLLVLGGMIYFMTPIFLTAINWTRKEKTSSVLSSTIPLPLTVGFCRNAWSTASQSLWIPNHGMIFEALAMKLWKLLIRRIFGWRVYSYLTGATSESEAARVKAWDIALDAQLAGGDPDADFGRLLLTFVASMTMKDTPLRLLRKSLHIQLVLWNVSNTYIARRLGIPFIARRLSNHFWLRASVLHESVQESRSGPNDGLEILDVPPHISVLMKQGSAAVLVDTLIIRTSHVARNELWALPDVTADEGLDAVFGDVTIRSPLDVLAALFSSLTLRNTLLATLVNSRKNRRQKSVTIGLQLALATAPPGSMAGMRARAAQAVFSESGRLDSIARALREIPKHHDDAGAVSFRFVEPALASICTTNVRVALRSAVLIAKVTNDKASSEPLNQSTRVSMLAAIERMLRSTDVTILGFAAAYRCARICQLDKAGGGGGDEAIGLELAGSRLESLIARLELIAKSDWSSRYGVDGASIRFGAGCL